MPYILFSLSGNKLERIMFFLLLRSHCVDDGRVVSDLAYFIKHGLRRKDPPDGYGPHKTPYGRFVRWSKFGMFKKFFTLMALIPG